MITKLDSKRLNELASEVHEANAKWWIDLKTGEPLRRNEGELLMLVNTELAEAVEGIRKNLMDDKVRSRTMEEVEMADALIRLLDYAGGFRIPLHESYRDLIPGEFYETSNKAEQILFITGQIFLIYTAGEGNVATPVCVQLSLAIRFIIEYCNIHCLDLMGAYADKMAFNAIREDHTHEARLAVNGKKF